MYIYIFPIHMHISQKKKRTKNITQTWRCEIINHDLRQAAFSFVRVFISFFFAFLMAIDIDTYLEREKWKWWEKT